MVERDCTQQPAGGSLLRRAFGSEPGYLGPPLPHRVTSIIGLASPSVISMVTALQPLRLGGDKELRGSTEPDRIDTG